MKALTVIILLLFTEFNYDSSNECNNLSPIGYWISKRFEHYTIPPEIGEGNTVYGSGTLLNLAKDFNSIKLGADFFWDDDSLYRGGEPGFSLRLGKWEIDKGDFILRDSLIIKTFLLPNDSLGLSKKSSIRFLNNQILVLDGDTLIRTNKFPKSLKHFSSK